MGSLREMETQTIIANRLGYIDEENLGAIQARIDSVENLLFRLIASLE